MLMFSSRLPPGLAPNSITRAIAELRSVGAPLVDLTETNPTAVGFVAPAEVLAALAEPAAGRYAPAPLGVVAAREAVAADYGLRGAGVDPAPVVLTSSTSEAYGFLFKLLCDAGDEVLVPQPSYPLFDLLTRLDVVTPRPYRLEYHGVWSIDRGGVERAATSRTRAILVVSPNNPTGSWLRQGDRDWLADFAAAQGIAIVADEVFADYPLARRTDASSFLGEIRALTFVLGGLSKSAGLPQVKLGWMVASGPPPEVRDALARLELIGDAYLSVSTPVQLAAARLIEAGREIRGAIARRIAANLDRLRLATRAYPAVSLLEPEGGWSAVLRVPSTVPEEELVLGILRESGVIVHPGYFFDFADEAFLVLSLLPEPEAFGRALGRFLPLAAGLAAEGRS
jgi:alanine-synthesizing transaminase